jgi:hypothetical protein
MWEVMRELLFGPEGYDLALFGLSLGLPLIGGIAKGVGSFIKGSKEDKRAGERLEIDQMLADLQRRRFEEGSPLRKAAQEHLLRGAPEKEDLSSLYAANPFVGGKKPLGASGVEASRALGFDTPDAAPLDVGPIAAPPPTSPGPGRGEVTPQLKESIRSPDRRVERNRQMKKEARRRPRVSDDFRPRDEIDRRTFYEAV